MGFNSQEAIVTGRPFCVFDIETAPIADAAEYVEPVEAPANYKDPEKIAAYIKDKQAEQIARAALNIDLCRIAAIGEVFQSGEEIVSTVDSEEAERLALSNFWRASDGLLLVGFNCTAFDLPVLIRRSQYLGVPYPRLLRKRYDTDGICDLADVLTFSGRVPLRSLSFYARRFGVPHDDTIKGADMPGLVAAGEWGKVAAHVRDDVQTTRALAERLGLIYVLQPSEPEAVEAF